MALLRSGALRILAVLGVALGAPGTVLGQLTQEEALAAAFPEAVRFDRSTAFLTDEQLSEAGELAGPEVQIESGVVTYYRALSGDDVLGVAYFDAHRVRTLPQVLMVVVGTDHRILRVETVSFREPPEYRSPDGWLTLFDGLRLDDELSLKGEVPRLTGATLTAASVVAATRRVLALHAVIRPFEAEASR